MNRIVVKTVTPQTNDQRRSEWEERFYRQGHHNDLSRWVGKYKSTREPVTDCHNPPEPAPRVRITHWSKDMSKELQKTADQLEQFAIRQRESLAYHLDDDGMPVWNTPDVPDDYTNKSYSREQRGED